jgi:Sap, sulfolipid-1-addressing protein
MRYSCIHDSEDRRCSVLTGGLLAGIAGLAALDAFNPATIAGVALILLAPIRRPVLASAAYVAGAYTVVLVVGVAVYLGADAAAGALTAGIVWVRRIAFGLAALLLLVAALRRLRTSHRSAVVLPSWFGPWTAAPLGVLVTGADLPNAFPYVIAIERLVDAAVPTGQALLVLVAYGIVYCLPCVALLVVGITRRAQVRARLQTVYDRIGRPRTVPRSIPRAVALMGLAAGVATLAAIA